MRVHQIRIDFAVTEQVKRYVFVYLIEAEACYLVDSGVYGSEEQIVQYMKTIGRDISEVKAVFLTHAHPDQFLTDWARVCSLVMQSLSKEIFLFMSMCVTHSGLCRQFGRIASSLRLAIIMDNRVKGIIKIKDRVQSYNILFSLVYWWGFFWERFSGEFPTALFLVYSVMALICGLASMNLMTAPSVSLEGKSLWLLQSLPVEPWRIFRAKIGMQLLLTGLPLLLCIVCTAAVYPMHALQLLILLLFAGSYALLMALAGLFLGVKMPTLTWTNEIMPIKQGGPVMITLFGGFVYMVLLFGGFMVLPGWILGFCGYMSCFVGANLLLSAWACLWLRKKGVARFAAL